MDLFQIVNGHAMPSVHALMIKPFKTIWENDTSLGRGEAIQIFTYVELLCSPKKSNPFSGYTEEERPAKVKMEVFGNSEYSTTDEMLFATIRYKELLMDSIPSYAAYVSGLNAVYKVRDFLDTVDLNQKNLRTGAPIFKASEIAATISKLPDLEKAMKAGIDKVHTELNENTKTRGQRVIGDYER